MYQCFQSTTDTQVQNCDVAQINAWCDRELNEYLPTAYEASNEAADNAALLEERLEELSMLAEEGHAIKQAIPALSMFKDTTLALLLLLSQDHYPGSRYRISVNLPGDGLPEVASNLVGYMLLTGMCINRGMREPDVTHPALLAYAIVRVLDGQAPIATLPDCFTAFARIDKAVREQDRTIDQLTEWQRRNEEITAWRRRGEFLYVGQPISPTRPETLAEAMGRHYRKRNVPIVVSQSPDDFGRGA